MTTLKNNNFTFVGRYLNRIEGYQECFTSAEVTQILVGGLYIVSLYQISKSLAHFTIANGVADAEIAVGLEKTSHPLDFLRDGLFVITLFFCPSRVHAAA